MAAGTLAAPGTAYGPCADECAHTDCASTRRRAEHICDLCETAIGYETRLFRVDDNTDPHERYRHAVCEWRRIEAGR